MSDLSRTISGLAAVLAMMLWLVTSPASASQLEALDRGLVALYKGNDRGVFLSWRLLGHESPDTGFNVYRQTANGSPVKLNEAPLAEGTNYLDEHPPLGKAFSYHVCAVVDGEEAEPSRRFHLSADPSPQDYLAIPLATPAGYTAGDASVGDFDGDGEYEFVVHMTGRGRDNSQSGMTDEPILHAYKLDGTRLWSIRLGKNIREGAHYTQFMVYDLDGDGKAEVVMKTADGTIDGVGQVIGDPAADHRQQPPQEEANSQGGRRAPPRGRRAGSRFGYVLQGPEYLTVFDGRSGAAIATVDYVPARHPEMVNPTPEQLEQVWGDGYGNRVDRFLACVAYLDGEHPSVVMCRGYYTRTVCAAWDWRDGELTQRWVFDSDQQGRADSSNPWRGQGNHSVVAADVDQDGRDEIVYGSMVIDDNGTGLYSTRLGHGDAQHVTDLDPTRPGLEIWSIHENPRRNNPGVELRNARTGELYLEAAHGRDVGRGMAADIDPRYPGCELWGGTRNLFDARGNDIGPCPRSQNMAIWWDGDLLRELLDGVKVTKWDYRRGTEEVQFDGRQAGLASNNGSKANPCLVADVLGDWREELIARTADNTELRIYTSATPTDHRLPTLMHDRQYRLSIAGQNVGYNQPPHPSFFLGHPTAESK
jgi:rhamnogalacturonan endolyase